ncbi:MAG: hypothetical protein FJY65_12315 [Calditrichaeota bacterium]|nr:hypothetical protein [Calditrichota bacterium]
MKNGESISASVSLPRFIVFGALKSMVKRLRMCGVDCAYNGGLSLPNTILAAISDERILLTTVPVADTFRLKVVLISESHPDSQFKHILKLFPSILEGEALSTCLVCNYRLENYQIGTSPADIPPSVLDRQLPLRRCPKCARIYWDGSHTERMRQLIKNLIESH